jgi:hypothetical protein
MEKKCVDCTWTWNYSFFSIGCLHSCFMSAVPHPRKAQVVHQLSFLCTTESVTQNSSTVLYIGHIHNMLVQDIFFRKYQWHFSHDACCAEVLRGQRNTLYWSQCVLQTHWDHLHSMSIKRLRSHLSTSDDGGDDSSSAG